MQTRRRKHEEITNVLLGIWCSIACFISPVWLTMIFLDITGIIYEYDYSMDEGTAIVIGMISLIVWIFLVLLPVIIFLKRMHSINKKWVMVTIAVIAVICILCIAMCNWDVVGFLTTPRDKY